jgi:hypothetical protein
MARADAARWKDLYEAVKTSDETEKLKQQHRTEVNNLIDKYEALLAESITVIEEKNASLTAAHDKINIILKTKNYGRSVGFAAAVITSDMVMHEDGDRPVEHNLHTLMNRRKH